MVYTPMWTASPLHIDVSDMTEPKVLLRVPETRPTQSRSPSAALTSSSVFVASKTLDAARRISWEQEEDALTWGTHIRLGREPGNTSAWNLLHNSKNLKYLSSINDEASPQIKWVELDCKPRDAQDINEPMKLPVMTKKQFYKSENWTLK